MANQDVVMIRQLTKIESICWRVMLAFADEAVALLSLFAALWLRFDDKSLSWILNHYIDPQLAGILLSAALYFLVLAAFKLYHHAWSFAGLETIWTLLIASVVAASGMVLIQYGLYGDVMPRSVVFLYWLLSFLGVATLRLLIRVFVHWLQVTRTFSDSSEPVVTSRTIIVGAAEQGAAILKAISQTRSLRTHEIIGFLDDRADKQGLFYGGVKVLGTTKLLKKYLDNREVDEVLFALSEDSEPEKTRQLVLECRKMKVLAKVIPDLAQQLLRPNSNMRLEDIRVEDLLRRPMRSVNIQEFGTYLTGKRVLITGAGGSIGSEICRQVMQLSPAEIILLGHGENSIFKIEQELRQSHPELASNIFSIIASIKNASRMNRVFSKFKPEVVFHAAAHKHLPLMEFNICEAVHNNVIGTYNLVNACVKNGVGKMVMISTDKAADPSCIMGATKHLCEVVVKSAAHTYARPDFVCVRFGNVLGSRGSVIPVFNDQISKGGPVTVTHPEMTRYFMTIPEAVRLVIQAGGVGRTGSIYLLDMGKPVKILDLAEDMIRLHGYEPYTDIPITFTGIRPGEKMHEQLASQKEEVMPSQHEGLNVVKTTTPLSQEEVNELIGKLRQCVEELDGGRIIEIFREVVPGYANSARAMFTRLMS